MAAKPEDALPEPQPPAEDDSWTDPKDGDGARWDPRHPDRKGV